MDHYCALTGPINGVREVKGTSAQYTLGGGPSDTNHPRIMDYLWPADMTPTQEEMLSNYSASQENPTTLGPDDFAQLEMWQ